MTRIMPQVALRRHVEEMKKLRKVNEKLDRELGALRWQAQHAKVVVTAAVTSEILQAIKPHVVHPLAYSQSLTHWCCVRAGGIVHGSSTQHTSSTRCDLQHVARSEGGPLSVAQAQCTG